MPQASDNTKSKLRLLFLLEAWLEAPMFLLALVWLWLFVIELTQGLTPQQQLWGTIIWVAFILEFTVKLAVAPHKWRYLKKNFLTLIALVIPALRAFRLLRALTVLRSARIVSSTRFVRALTSTNRLIKDIQEAQGQKPGREVNVGLLIALSPSGGKADMTAFTGQLLQDAKKELENASAVPWTFHPPRYFSLEDESPRRPSYFIDEASRHMAEGPYDVVLVVTDVGLQSRRDRIESGLFSHVSHLVLLSTYELIGLGRKQETLSLEAPSVRWNGVTLLLHLMGHIVGLGHKTKSESEIMAPFHFRDGRRVPPQFTQGEKHLLRKKAVRVPERELRGGGLLATLFFHVLMVFRHPMKVISPLLKGRAILLTMSLPSLATAAVAPTLILIFSAEIWDVGMTMTNRTTAIFAVASVLGASFYLVKIQSLFLPRKEKDTVTEHLAVANSVIFLSILLGCIGLFFLVCSLMLLIQFYVFPEGLMQTWPTLDNPNVTLVDQLRIAAFISTIGVTTGALAGGLEKRAVIQHLALFHDEP